MKHRQPTGTDSVLAYRGVRRAAELLGLSQRTVATLIAANALPHRRVGRALLFLPDEIEGWLSAGCPRHEGAADEVRRGMRTEEALLDN